MKRKKDIHTRALLSTSILKPSAAAVSLVKASSVGNAASKTKFLNLVSNAAMARSWRSTSSLAVGIFAIAVGAVGATTVATRKRELEFCSERYELAELELGVILGPESAGCGRGSFSRIEDPVEFGAIDRRGD